MSTSIYCVGNKIELKNCQLLQMSLRFKYTILDKKMLLISLHDELPVNL